MERIDSRKIFLALVCLIAAIVSFFAIRQAVLLFQIRRQDSEKNQYMIRIATVTIQRVDGARMPSNSWGAAMKQFDAYFGKPLSDAHNDLTSSEKITRDLTKANPDYKFKVHYLSQQLFNTRKKVSFAWKYQPMKNIIAERNVDITDINLKDKYSNFNQSSKIKHELIDIIHSFSLARMNKNGNRSYIIRPSTQKKLTFMLEYAKPGYITYGRFTDDPRYLPDEPLTAHLIYVFKQAAP